MKNICPALQLFLKTVIRCLLVVCSKTQKRLFVAVVISINNLCLQMSLLCYLYLWTYAPWNFTCNLIMNENWIFCSVVKIVWIPVVELFEFGTSHWFQWIENLRVKLWNPWFTKLNFRTSWFSWIKDCAMSLNRLRVWES